MRTVADECLEKAAEFRVQAEQSALPRVKEKWLRSAAAWESLADRRLRHERLKAPA